MTRAAVYLPHATFSSDAERWTKQCLLHVERMGLELTTVVRGIRDDDQWSSVEQLLQSGQIDIVVVALREHLGNQPYTVAEEWIDPNKSASSQRRTGRIRPGDRFTEPARTYRRPQVLPR